MMAERRTHVARFVDGPRDRESVVVPALESGQPPELLLTPGKPEWVYVRAGAQRPDGSLPRALQVAERLDLDIRRRVAFMSTGMRQKLALAVVALSALLLAHGGRRRARGRR